MKQGWEGQNRIVSWKEEWGVRASFCQWSWPHKALTPFQHKRGIYLSPPLIWFLEILSWKVRPSTFSVSQQHIPLPLLQVHAWRPHREVMHSGLTGWLEHGCASVWWCAQWTEMCIFCYLKKKNWAWQLYASCCKEATVSRMVSFESHAFFSTSCLLLCSFPFNSLGPHSAQGGAAVHITQWLRRWVLQSCLWSLYASVF